MKLIRKRRIDTNSWNSYKLNWNNLDNPVNLTGIWKNLNIENFEWWEKRSYDDYTSIFNFERPIFGNEKYLISLYLTTDSPETGLIFRPMLCKYYGWDDDQVKFYDTQSNEHLLKIFMKGLGLEFKRYPTSDECVKMIEKLSEMDEKFKKQFNDRFIIEEIPETRDELVSEFYKSKDDCREKDQKIAEKERKIEEKNGEISKLYEKLHQKDLLLQRVLIDEHRKECEQLVDDWEKAVENSKRCHDELEQIRQQLAENPKDSDLNRKRKIAKDLWTDAKWQINLVRKQGMERIFGRNQEYIDFEYMMDYLRKTFFMK